MKYVFILPVVASSGANTGRRLAGSRGLVVTLAVGSVDLASAAALAAALAAAFARRSGIFRSCRELIIDPE